MIFKKYPAITINFFLFSILSLFSSCSKSPSVTSEKQDLKNKIITVAKANHIPTLSVLIKWKNDELKFLYQDKYKNIEPVNVYGIGSTTKFLCSLIFLKYVESGKINLEDPITDYIAKDSLPAIPWVNSIKVKHLLNHTSGIPDYTQNPSWINLITN